MKDFFAKKSVGFYFTVIAAVLVIAGTVMYTSVMYTNPLVYGFLIAAIVRAVLIIALSGKYGDKAFYNWTPVIGAVLAACAAVWGAELMVNQIGYIVSGLDEMSTIMSFIYYEVVMVIALLVWIIASFLKQVKQN
ncbi:MAG TPA: hypothetical protein H9697_04585 [Candidatus Mediterraneibacter faecavium]|uniref:Uncharacterized protein n=1 Tax=Candidatus Mediterraneibacter faecavium TaxID=2838668 RepID=A0A9D2QA38_9FIRM|nr:hypothetical protein [Candidatus Mediterraneibacter faecavium]